MANAASKTIPQEVVRKIYATMQEGILTALIKWHRDAGVWGSETVLLHSISNYVPRIGMPPSPWDDLYFPFKCVLTVDAINTALVGYPIIDLLIPFTVDDAGVDAVPVSKTIYLTVPYMDMGIYQ